MTAPVRHATLADLARTPGKAELINGRIVEHPMMKYGAGNITARICGSLDDHTRATGVGEMYTSTLAYAIPILPSGRESFSPFASYYDGPLPANPMAFIEGPPTFAVEVRSEDDYGPSAEAAMADKRDDYFQAGTLAVWDVDPRAKIVTLYRQGQAPVVFRPGQIADAEPAVPGWRIAVDEVFAQ